MTLAIHKDGAREFCGLPNGGIGAAKITIGKNVTFGKNVDINVRGEFEIGDYSRLGNDVKIRGNNVRFGKHLYHSKGLDVGGGGNTNPQANLTIGDRCVIHDNYINIAEPVNIGNDVGLSREVSIQTHGYWLSVLDGFPAKFAGVMIGDGVIVGYRATILPGVEIAARAVIGACSVVTKDLGTTDAVYVGNPCRLIRHTEPPTEEEKAALVEKIVLEYLKVARHHGYNPVVEVAYPFIHFRGCVFSVEYLTFEGPEDVETDHFRDYMRKWGLRFYSERPFRSVIKK